MRKFLINFPSQQQPPGAAAALRGVHHRAGPGGQPPLPPHRQARRRQGPPHHLRRPRPQGRQGGLVQVSETVTRIMVYNGHLFLYFTMIPSWLAQ